MTNIKNLIENQILLVDGAMGTMIQSFQLTPEDFGGENYEGCNEYLNVINPEIIKTIHTQFLDAGADIIETNSFGGTPLVLAEYQLANKAFEINFAAATLARGSIQKYHSDLKPRFVAGSMGPTTKSLFITGGLSWESLAADYKTQAEGLIQGGCDFLLLETSQDTLNVKAAINGINQAFRYLKKSVPLAIQCTIESMGTMLAGQDIEAFYNSVAHNDLLWIGLNCATGPEFMREHLRLLSSISKFPVACIPNAGLPDEHGNYNETPSIFTNSITKYLESNWVNVIGGCCGTTPEHIEKLSKVIIEFSTRNVNAKQSSTIISGLEALEIDESIPFIIGERTNVLGSKLFKRLISDGNFEQAAEIGRKQVQSGAHIIDVCLQDPDRDEIQDMMKFLTQLTRKIKTPIMIDSTDHNVIKTALTYIQGKSLINSINLEDGESRFKTVVPIAKEFGAGLVVGCIDDDKEQAQAITRQRKLEVASRSIKLLVEEYHFPESDIFIDPLVFPVGTGDSNYVGSAIETIESIKLIKTKFPRVKTVLGISNVSFGLPSAGREVLNSLMLYLCVQNGLDAAIVNSQGLLRYASISSEEKRLAENLIYGRGENPITDFANYFREQKPKIREDARKKLPLNDRLSSYVIEGTKDGLIADLDLLLKEIKPLEIINGPLMNGMNEVGRLFAQNELIVAEVLESAESMKAAVNHLEQYMDLNVDFVKGSIILATVKGDVHDIGKNLVDIILSNNGYKVINLGIKISSSELISAFQKYKPNLIGLSGLLVKSAQMMVDTAKDLKNADIYCPLLVGGAALTNRFTRLRIAPEYDGIVLYCQDAMNGLSIANQVIESKEQENIKLKLNEESVNLENDIANKSIANSNREIRRKNISTLSPNEIVNPPDLQLHITENSNIYDILRYINPVMLYNRHLGYRGKFESDLNEGKVKAVELYEKVLSIADIMHNERITAKAVFQFYKANSDGDNILIFSPDKKTILETFHFGRQTNGSLLCLSDFLPDTNSNTDDYIAFFTTSIGPNIREIANKLISAGEYLSAHIFQAVAIESAEAFAEMLHQQIRTMWGFKDTHGINYSDLFKGNYRGKRFSFGYPACPRLEDQEKLWRLIQPDKHISVKLTEEFMMDPECSVSALVIHHPEAQYFNLDENARDLLEKKLSH